MKNLLNLEGVKTLGRTQQKTIFGGYLIEFGDPAGGGGCKACTSNSQCPSGVCITYSGPDCGTVACGCGSWC